MNQVYIFQIYFSHEQLKNITYTTSWFGALYVCMYNFIWFNCSFTHKLVNVIVYFMPSQKGEAQCIMTFIAMHGQAKQRFPDMQHSQQHISQKFQHHFSIYHWNIFKAIMCFRWVYSPFFNKEESRSSDAPHSKRTQLCHSIMMDSQLKGYTWWIIDGMSWEQMWSSHG